jgi:hypothetical protein
VPVRNAGGRIASCPPHCCSVLAKQECWAVPSSLVHGTKPRRLVGLEPRACVRPKAQGGRWGGQVNEALRSSTLTDGLRGSSASLSAYRLQQGGQEPIEKRVVRILSRTPRFARNLSRLQCSKEVTSAGEVEVSGGKVLASESKTLAPGTYCWQASYSGDATHPASRSRCGAEVETVTAKPTATCGKTTVGKSSDSLLANFKRVNQCTLPVNATVSELSIYLTPTSHSGQQLIKGIFYADSKGKPAALLGTTVQLSFTSKSSAGWYHLSFPTPLKLVAGNYWIGMITGAGQYVAGERYSSVANAEDSNTNSYTAGASNPFGSFKMGNEQMSLYATYAPSGQ